jgi:thiamine-phosphate pyrophosphorylase
MESKKIFRIIDANFNRYKEGLRVLEDIFRFVLEDDKLRKKTRKIRHSLDNILNNKELANRLIRSRESKKDLGRKVDIFEAKRQDLHQIFYVNLQRAKESLRVLEEFFKILDLDIVAQIKKSRYELYDLEKDVLKKQLFLSSSRLRRK